MTLVTVTLAEGAFAEKQKHDLAARLTDVIVRCVARAERS
jgi:phenylpyruvate tautomerase PptA (4-oxalocrotonate tautomerase family)